MSHLIKKISNLILKNNNIINENIIGINYLEKLKYLVISNLKDNQNNFTIDHLVSELKDKNNQSSKFEFKSHSLSFSINLFNNSSSKIKLTHNNDILFIVVNGIKTISIFDFQDQKKNISLSISKNMGLVLSKNTITSENVAAGSIILDIISEKNAMKIEN